MDAATVTTRVALVGVFGDGRLIGTVNVLSSDAVREIWMEYTTLLVILTVAVLSYS